KIRSRGEVMTSVNAAASLRSLVAPSNPPLASALLASSLNCPEKLTLCDYPGLVFPSFTSSRYEMVASGILSIDHMTEQWEAVQVVASRVLRSVIEEVYKISFPKPKTVHLWWPSY
ncbi:large subunit GTPase 1 homolog, partial [Phtheirospermum japonicum]